MELFDSHAHYNDEKFDIDREEVIEEVYKSGVTKLINAGYSLNSSKYALEIAFTRFRKTIIRIRIIYKR